VKERSSEKENRANTFAVLQRGRNNAAIRAPGAHQFESGAKGHDFSRAAKIALMTRGFSPCGMALLNIDHRCLRFGSRTRGAGKNERPETEPPALAVRPRPFEEASRDPLLSKAC
jgi:hypothetical protein